MERKNQRISDLFYNNRFLLVFSVVAAIALWLVVAVEYGPEDTNTVAVEVDPDLEYINNSLNLTCYGEYDKIVNVTIRGQRLVVESDGIENQISARLRTGTVTGAGLYPLAITISKTNDSTSDFEIIGDTSQPYYNLYFDSEMKKPFVIEPDIEFEKEINAEQFYIFGEEKYKIDPYKITVTGPATYVSKIEKVVAKAVVKDEIKQNLSVTADLVLLDANGNIIDPKTNYLTLSETQTVINIPVYKVQNMKIGYSTINRPETYTKVGSDPFSVTFNPPTVKVAVPEASLNASNELEVIQIDYSKLHKGVKPFEVNTSEIDGCVFLDGTQKITVIVNTGDVASTTVSSPDISSIGFENIPEGRKITPVSIDFENVSMVGPESSVLNLTTSDLRIRVDLSEITDSVKGEVQVKAFVETDDCWSYGEDYYVTVKVE